MKLIITVILLAFSGLGITQNEYLMQDAITKPSLSLRCKELLNDRSEKVVVQQRLNALLQRSQDLIRKSPKARTTMHSRLLSNQVRIKNELHITALNIETMEENVVRSGCPGISL
jgi:hypothetical protein